MGKVRSGLEVEIWVGGGGVVGGAWAAGLGIHLGNEDRNH